MSLFLDAKIRFKPFFKCFKLKFVDTNYFYCIFTVFLLYTLKYTNLFISGLTGPYSVIISNPTYSTSMQDSSSTHLSSFSSPQQSYLISPTPLDFINPTQQQFSILSSSNSTFTIPVSTYTNPYEQSRTHWHEYNQDQSMCELKLYSVPEEHDHSSSFSKQRSNSSMPLDSGFNLD